MSKSLHRLLSYLAAAFSFLMAALAYVTHIYLIGFPDGHINDYEHVAATLHKIYIALNSLLGIYFIYLARITGGEAIVVRLMIAFFILLGSTVLTYLVDGYLFLNFDHGQGG